jgi:enterochelin esterase-like enzyme
MAPAAATVIDGLELVFRLPDPDRSARSVRLLHDLQLAPGEDEFSWSDGVWTARVPRPWLARVEYAYERTEYDGTRTVVLDPSNPRRVGELRGHLGERSTQDVAATVTRSWLPMPGYREPWWLSALGAPGELMSPALRSGACWPASIHVWTPSALDPVEPHATAILPDTDLPLLVCHDGPELADRASLVQFAAAMVSSRSLPPFRVALLSPRRRLDDYSADAEYARLLTHEVVPLLRQAVPVRDGLVLAGVSLGGLAAVHAEWCHPGSFAALFAQSGSFFTRATDPQEADFVHFERICDFVDLVGAADRAPSSARIAMTCGSTEENSHCNRLMAAALRSSGIDCTLTEHPDKHTMTSWRDSFAPSLNRLLAATWRRPA